MNIIQKKSAFAAFVIAALFLMPICAALVHADTIDKEPGTTIDKEPGTTIDKEPGATGPNSSLPKLSNPLTATSLEELLATIVDVAMNIGIVFATIMIIFAGFKFVMARGNATELEAAKHLFMYVIIGLAILIAAKAIVGIIKSSLLQAKVVDPKVFNRTP